MTHYPPFKHFTLMEQTPTTASDSAAAMNTDQTAWEEKAIEVYPEYYHDNAINERRLHQRSAYIAGATAATLRERQRLRKLVEQELKDFANRGYSSQELEAIDFARARQNRWFLSLLSDTTDKTAMKP